MSQSQRRFVTFGISHYCEKARWALDWHGIAYKEINWPPGVHLILAKSCGAKRTSLPILLHGQAVIQGSGAIIDWADQQAQDPARRLNPPEAREIERRADRVIGVHVRRLAYSELLPRFPELAKPALFGKASGTHRLLGNAMWPLTRRAMIRMYGITPEAAAESRSILESELDWLDKTLADKRRYLVGDRFSRADITVASLLALFARPQEMPTYHEMSIPGALLADVERWRDRPVMRWVVAQYQTHRLSTPAAG
ncbi:glutathione S-transferase family protein [Methyloceanibacter sp.]|uniref:glutathione S-transferase family protein n=1 Tax=Methyloceanibacter sp. TaxID=1965321 RepID=UPI003D6CC1DE